MTSSAFTPSVLTISSGGTSGSGQGELNIVTNPSAATDTAGSLPSGWSNGTSHTVTKVASSSPLDPTIATAVQVQASANGTAAVGSGGGTASLTMPASLRNRKLKLEFYFTSPAADTWRVDVYAGSTRVPLSTDSGSPASSNLPAGVTSKWTAYFDADSSSSYTVRWTRTAGTGTTNLLLTQVIVGPGIQPQGAVVGEWQTTTLTPSAAAFGTVSNQTYWIKREGSEAIIRGSFQTGTPAASPAVIAMPAGLTINYSVLAASTRGRLGRFEIGTTTGNSLISSTDREGVIYFDGSNTSNLNLTVQTTTYGYYPNNGTALTGGAAYILFEARVPIAEWAGSGTVQLAQNDVEYAYNTGSWDATDSINFGYGPTGQLIPQSTDLADLRKKRVRFQTPIQATDVITIELQVNGKWMPVSGVISTGEWNLDQFSYGATASTTSSKGIGYRAVAGSNTDIDVFFGRYATIYNGVTTPIGWGTYVTTSVVYWRVRKSSAGAAVGVGLVAKDSAGLLPAYNSNLDDATATRLGLKQYVAGTTYNGVTPDVTGSNWTRTRGIFIPYQCQDGTWRLKFNVRGVFSGATNNNFWALSVTGIVAKNFLDYQQQVALSSISAISAPYGGYITNNTNTITAVWTPVTTYNGNWSMSGDIELDSKPTWAYS